ncbi:hypothetical protein ACEQ8H_002686 [Pleosporales sp. CAS-2024a]
MAAPGPQTWTLRLKSRKTTVLLHVDPLQTFAGIKSDLYDALKATGGLHDPETRDAIPLPESPLHIQLGRPVDVHDAQLGFRLGEWEELSAAAAAAAAAAESEDESGGGKGKGKAKAGKKLEGGTAGVVGKVKDCPKGAGLRDGAVLAFRWAGDGIWDGHDDADREQHGGAKPDMWGVRLASFEDAYGVNNESDVGGAREFEG